MKYICEYSSLQNRLVFCLPEFCLCCIVLRSNTSRCSTVAGIANSGQYRDSMGHFMSDGKLVDSPDFSQFIGGQYRYWEEHASELSEKFPILGGLEVVQSGLSKAASALKRNPVWWPKGMEVRRKTSRIWRRICPCHQVEQIRWTADAQCALFWVWPLQFPHDGG